MATEELYPELMEPCNACRLTPLDKNPRVRPIGIGEVMRRIIGQTITKCLKNELMSLGSNYQLCLGQKCGIQYAIHALRDQYSKPSADAVLLIDAKNAFNSLNRKLALKNIENTCPSLLTAIKNSYSNPSKLFVNKKNNLLSRRDDPERSTSSGHVQSSHNTPLEIFINRRCNPEFVRRRRKRSQ